MVGQNTHIIIESATQNTCRKDIFIEMLIFLLFLIEYHNDMMSRVMIKLRDPHCPGGYTFHIYTYIITNRPDPKFGGIVYEKL